MTLEFNAPLNPKIMALITDAEYEKTESLLIKTPSGKKVKFIKASMLDKIRTEIMMKDGLEEALEIIDKYREVVKK